MVKIVRVLLGEWQENPPGCYEHVTSTDGYVYGIPTKETDTFEKVQGTIKEILRLPPDDHVELTYQWPAWMLGPMWKEAKPITVQDDEDMSLFLAIRADLEEMFLCCRVIPRISATNINLSRMAGERGEGSQGKTYSYTEVTRMLLGNMIVRSEGGSVTERPPAEKDSLEEFGRVGHITGSEMPDSNSGVARCLFGNSEDGTIGSDGNNIDSSVTKKLVTEARLATGRLTAEEKGK